MNLPARRKPARSGIERTEAVRECYGHRKWIRGHTCSVPGCQGGPIECAHVQGSPVVPYEDRGGLQKKASDKWTYPLCADHHAESHRIGHDTFDRRHGIDRAKIAAALFQRSPHRHKFNQGE